MIVLYEARGEDVVGVDGDGHAAQVTPDAAAGGGLELEDAAIAIGEGQGAVAEPQAPTLHRRSELRNAAHNHRQPLDDRRGEDHKTYNSLLKLHRTFRV